MLSGPDRNASSADLARMLLTVKHGEGVWDQPMQTFGLLQAATQTMPDASGMHP